MTWELFRITPFWEIDAFIYLLILAITIMLLAIAFDFSKAYHRYRSKWKGVRPHYGSVYSGIKGEQAKSNVKVWRA